MSNVHYTYSFLVLLTDYTDRTDFLSGILRVRCNYIYCFQIKCNDIEKNGVSACGWGVVLYSCELHKKLSIRRLTFLGAHCDPP